MAFNEGPVWLYNAIARLWSNVEGYGTPILLVAIVVYILWKQFLEKKYKDMVAPPFAIIRERMANTDKSSIREDDSYKRGYKNGRSEDVNGRDSFVHEMSKIREKQQRELEEAARIRAAKMKEEGEKAEKKDTAVKKYDGKSSFTSRRSRGSYNPMDGAGPSCGFKSSGSMRGRGGGG